MNLMIQHTVFGENTLEKIAGLLISEPDEKILSSNNNVDNVCYIPILSEISTYLVYWPELSDSTESTEVETSSSSDNSSEYELDYKTLNENLVQEIFSMINNNPERDIKSIISSVMENNKMQFLNLVLDMKENYDAMIVENFIAMENAIEKEKVIYIHLNTQIDLFYNAMINSVNAQQFLTNDIIYNEMLSFYKKPYNSDL